MCGVWARSGDIWGKRDSFLYHYRDCSDHINNQYTFYISGPNSKVDDWVKGGLLARSSLARSSPYFGVFRVGEHHGIRIQYRVAAQGDHDQRGENNWVPRGYSTQTHSCS